MLVIPGQPGKDLCDRHLGLTRRDLLRVGGSGLLGLTLGKLFDLQARAADAGHTASRTVATCSSVSTSWRWMAATGCTVAASSAVRTAVARAVRSAPVNQ